MLNSNLNNLVCRYGTVLECYGLEMIYTFQISIETHYPCNGIRTRSFKEEIMLLGEVDVFWEVVLYLPGVSCYKQGHSHVWLLLHGFACLSAICHELRQHKVLTRSLQDRFCVCVNFLHLSISFLPFPPQLILYPWNLWSFVIVAYICVYGYVHV